MADLAAFRIGPGALEPGTNRTCPPSPPIPDPSFPTSSRHPHATLTPPSHHPHATLTPPSLPSCPHQFEEIARTYSSHPHRVNLNSGWRTGRDLLDKLLASLRSRLPHAHFTHDLADIFISHVRLLLIKTGLAKPAGGARGAAGRGRAGRRGGAGAGPPSPPRSTVSSSLQVM